MRLTRLVVCLVLLAISLGSAQRVETTRPATSSRPGFDPKDVVRQVRSGHSTPRTLDPSTPGLDDGEFLIDTSITILTAPFGQGSLRSPLTARISLWSGWTGAAGGTSTTSTGCECHPEVRC